MVLYIPVRGWIKVVCWVIMKMSVGDTTEYHSVVLVSDNSHPSKLSIETILYQLPLLITRGTNMQVKPIVW